MKKSTKIIISIVFALMMISFVCLVIYELTRPRTQKELSLYHSCESLLEAEARVYSVTNENNSIMKKDTLKENCYGCQYYVEWNEEKNAYTAYLSCRGYETEGFNKAKLN